jgi:hypothetical protein
MTAIEAHENKIMKKVRMFIEHTYGSIDSHFMMMNTKSEWKIKGNSNLPAKLQFIFFLANCHTCGNGNSTSKTFEQTAPTLDEFLFGVN